MILTKKTNKILGEKCVTLPLSTTNLTWTWLASILSPYRDRPTTNHPSQDIASVKTKFV